MATKKGSKKKTEEVKPPVAGEGTPPPASSGPEEPVGEEAGKAPESIKGNGRYQVLKFKDGVRMYAPEGQKASPLVDASDSAAVSKLTREASRHNALLRGRTIATPKGHNAAQ